jgi:hypothetical protein
MDRCGSPSLDRSFSACPCDVPLSRGDSNLAGHVSTRVFALRFLRRLFEGLAAEQIESSAPGFLRGKAVSRTFTTASSDDT